MTRLPDTHTKTTSSFRLSDEAKWLLGMLAKRRGINMTSALEVLIREEAERRGIPIQDAGCSG